MCYVTKFAPRKALKLIGRDYLTFDERAVVHRMEREGASFADSDL